MLCSVSENMNLSSSGLCKSLLKHGGKSLQDECSSRHNNKLPAGQVVDIASGKLPCKVVLLANLPQYTKESTKEVSIIYLNTLPYLPVSLSKSVRLSDELSEML